MGEFSAGKSTLANIMLGIPAIPVQVTATHLPPVWLSHGNAPPCHEDLAGGRHPLAGGLLPGPPLADTAFIRLEAEADVLEACDLIDTPGLSDPNMPPETWERAAAAADGVLWLTHATQAWRQSEAAAWETLPERLRTHSLLIVTRFDKLTAPSDRARVLARLGRETAGLFRGIVPMSLTQALGAGDDAGEWAASGGAAFSDAVHALLTDLQRALARPGAGTVRRMPQGATVRAAPFPGGAAPAAAVAVPVFDGMQVPSGGRAAIVPRRVAAPAGASAREPRMRS